MELGDARVVLCGLLVWVDVRVEVVEALLCCAFLGTCKIQGAVDSPRPCSRRGNLSQHRLSWTKLRSGLSW